MKKNWLIYGSLMGLLMIVLEVTQYKTIVKDVRIELFGVVIGILFLLIGVWLGMTWIRHRSTSTNFDRSKLGLSKREVEVLQLLSEGLSNQEIADKLFVSLNTVKTHLSKIYQKLHAKRRTQAIQKARAMALVTNSGDEF